MASGSGGTRTRTSWPATVGRSSRVWPSRWSRASTPARTGPGSRTSWCARRTAPNGSITAPGSWLSSPKPRAMPPRASELRGVGAVLVLGQEPLELGGQLVGGRHGLTLAEQARSRVPTGLGALGGSVVLLLQGADQLGDLGRLLDLAADRLVGPVGRLAQVSV